MTARPPIETASLPSDSGDDRIAGVDYTDGRYDWLADRTGLAVSVVRELRARHRIGDLYGPDSRLLPREELRAKFGGPPLSGRGALEVVRSKRWGAAPITPSQAQREVLRLRRPGYGR